MPRRAGRAGAPQRGAVATWCDRVDAAGRGIDEGRCGDVGPQRGRQHPGYQRDGVAGRDQGQLAGQIGRGEIDAGADPGAGGVPAQECRRAVVVLDPDLVGQRPHVHRAAPGLCMADGQGDDHVVQPEEPVFDPLVMRQSGWCVGDDGDVEIACDQAVVQWCAQARQQAPPEGTGLLQQTPDGLGDDPRGQRRCRADGQRPVARPVTNISYGANGAVGLVQRGQGVAPEHLARRRRTHTTRMALHQGNAELPLQPGDLPGDGRLRVIELDGRRRQRPESAHGHEGSPHRQFHGASMTSRYAGYAGQACEICACRNSRGAPRWRA